MSNANRPRVGLVLGGGGVIGGAWLVGTLNAIATQSGWDPASADYVVGTSAGSMIGALLACGIPPWFMVAHSAGENLEGLPDARGGAPSSSSRSGGSTYRLERRGFALGPGSWRLAVASLARPSSYSPLSVISGWLPRGLVSTEPLKETIRGAWAGSWAPHPNYWAIAVDYTNGRRVAFGRAGSPPAQLPDAVAASCAVPGFYRAVEIDGRPYVDGGVRSASNLDVLRDEGLDIVVALNPMSSQDVSVPRTVVDRLAARTRQGVGRRLGSEAKRLRAGGTEVLLIQPSLADLEVMGPNPMSGRRRHEVMVTAERTMAERLRDSDLGARLARLPAGDPRLVRRPQGPPSTWPDFHALAQARWADLQAA